MTSSITSDPRYSIAQEYCGHDTPRWVVRFCGDWVGEAATKVKARELAMEYELARWNRREHEAESGASKETIDNG